MVVHPAPHLTARRRIAISTAANYLGKFVALGIGFVLTPYILHHIGTADYGLWIMVGSVAGYGSLLDFGVGNAVVKYVAEVRSRNEMQAAGPMVATALAFYISVGLTGIAIAAIAAGQIDTWLPHLGVDAPLVVLLVGSSVAWSLPGSAATAVLRGLQRFDVVNAISTTIAVLTAIAQVLALSRGGGLVGLLAVNWMSLLVSQAATLVAVRSLAPDLQFGSTAPTRALLRPIFAFSWSIFIVHVAGRLKTKTDEIVIGSLGGLSAVTPYAVARRLSELPKIATEQFLAVILPVASEMHSANDPERLKRLFVTSSRITLAVLLPVGMTIGVLSTSFLIAWVGRDYAYTSTTCVILIASSIIDLSVWPAASILQALSRHKLLAIGALSTGVANLVLSILLFPSFGIAGVAFGTLLPTAVECLLFVWPYTVKSLGVNWLNLLQHSICPAVVPLLPSSVVLGLMMQTIAPSTFLTIAFVGGLTLFTYAVGYLLQPVVTVEREVLSALLRRVNHARRFRS